MVAAAQGAIEGAHGVILAAPAVRGRETLNAAERAGLWTLAHSLPWVTGRPGNTGIRPSDNIEMLRALGRDPLIIKDTRVDALWGLVDLMDSALAAARGLNGPMLILVGANDDLIPDGPTALMLSRLPESGAGPRTVAVYADGYHMVLRDLQAAVVHRDVAHWIAARLAGTVAALPSGADRIGASGRLR